MDRFCVEVTENYDQRRYFYPIETVDREYFADHCTCYLSFSIHLFYQIECKGIRWRGGIENFIDPNFSTLRAASDLVNQNLGTFMKHTNGFLHSFDDFQNWSSALFHHFTLKINPGNIVFSLFGGCAFTFAIILLVLFLIMWDVTRPFFIQVFGFAFGIVSSCIDFLIVNFETWLRKD